MGLKTTYVLAAALLIAAGFSERWITYRRGHNPAVGVGVTRLEQIPLEIGSWVGRDVPLDELILRVADCAGYKNREYTNTRTGRVVELGVMVGLPGPMAEHTPEVCLPSLGYTLVKNSLERVGVARFLGTGGAGELAKMEFVHSRAELPMAVWHGWFDGTQWSRPDYSRLRFVNRKVLYRLQVSALLEPDPLADDPSRTIDPGKEFLAEALPVLTELFAGSHPAARQSTESLRAALGRRYPSLSGVDSRSAIE